MTSTRNVALVRSIGADRIIDYTNEDFTKGGPRYDFILDNVGNHSLSDTMQALTAGGHLLANGGGHSGGKLARVIRSAIVSMFDRRLLRPSVKSQNRDDLVVLKELIEAGQITPVVGGTYPLDRTPEAIDHVAQGHARGTVVISVAPSSVGALTPANAVTLAGAAA